MTIGAQTQVQHLAERVRAYLQRMATRGVPITYHDLAKALQLKPPNRIHLVTEALELLMADDIKAGRPLIAALAISKVRSGLPAPGFFDCAARLGRFSEDAAGPEAWAFHAREFHAAIALWNTNGRPGGARLEDR
jgi:hypothetical protein